MHFLFYTLNTPEKLNYSCSAGFDVYCAMKVYEKQSLLIDRMKKEYSFVCYFQEISYGCYLRQISHWRWVLISFNDAVEQTYSKKLWSSSLFRYKLVIKKWCLKSYNFFYNFQEFRLHIEWEYQNNISPSEVELNVFDVFFMRQNVLIHPSWVFFSLSFTERLKV